jgi:hypothetical protein
LRRVLCKLCPHYSHVWDIGSCDMCCIHPGSLPVALHNSSVSRPFKCALSDIDFCAAELLRTWPKFGSKFGLQLECHVRSPVQVCIYFTEPKQKHSLQIRKFLVMVLGNYVILVIK